MAEAPQPGNIALPNRLEALSDADLATVVAGGRHLNLPADWALLGEKTAADKAYLILDGVVSVRKGGAEVARLGPGEVIGEIGIVNHKLRTATVVSLTPMEVLHFTRETLERLLVDVPAFGAALQGTTEDRLADDRG